MDRNDFIENILGGIFAVIAVAAAVAELFIGGVTAASAAACVKDIFGTLTVVVLFFAMVRDKLPRADFRQRFDAEMDAACEKYGALVRKETLNSAAEQDTKYAAAKRNKLASTICYVMADNINVMFGTPCNNYQRFLEVQNGDAAAAKFLLRKTFFNSPDFNENTLKSIGAKLYINLSAKYGGDWHHDEKKNEITVSFGRALKSSRDARMLAEICDHAVMLYVAESKK